MSPFKLIIMLTILGVVAYIFWNFIVPKTSKMNLYDSSNPLNKRVNAVKKAEIAEEEILELKKKLEKELSEIDKEFQTKENSVEETDEPITVKKKSSKNNK